MDILKARKKAKEGKDGAGGTGASPPSSSSGAPSPSPSTATSAEFSATSEPASDNEVGTPIHYAVRRDPLAEFLAIYDEGELASVPELEGMAPDEEEKRFLSFDLAGEAYAADIMDVREILKVVALTEVPRAPREVLGVLSKRGIVMPVVDLATLLGLRTVVDELDKDQRVLVAGDGDRVCGLRVDRVRQVVRLAERNIEGVPPSLGTKNAHMLLGLGRARVDGQQTPQMLILLDIPAVLVHFSETMGIEPHRAGGR